MNCQFVQSVATCHATGPYAGRCDRIRAGGRTGRSTPQTRTPTGKPVRTAAFFDLDKTVIAKSSTLAFSKPFFDQGLINRRAVLKSTYAQFLFLMSGADHDQMDRGSYIFGWQRTDVRSVIGEATSSTSNSGKRAMLLLTDVRDEEEHPGHAG